MNTRSKTRYGLWAAALVVLAAVAIASPARALNTTTAALTPLPPVTEADGSLGTCYTFYETNEQSLIPYALNAGSRWDRFDFRWNVIEEIPGSPNFAPHDGVVNLDVDGGLSVVGILGSTAKWDAVNCPVSTASQMLSLAAIPGHPPLPESTDADLVWWRPCPPASLYQPLGADPANSSNYWGRFVYRTVMHFKDRVHVWELWNEPDLTMFWLGSPQDYAQLLKVGYQAVKAADPTATVLFGGLAYWGNRDFYVAVLDILKTMPDGPANSYFFDVMSLHLYSNVYTIGPVASGIQSAMTSRVGFHPIWLTETGVPLWDEHPTNPGIDYDNAATIEEAAAYTLQSYAEARRQGVAKYFFFRIHDELMSEAFGLMRNDRSLRPAYLAYQVAARYLHGENQITGPFTDANVRRITFWGTPRGRIDVLWNTAGLDVGPVTYTAPAILPTATLVDHHGATQTLTASGGAYALTLQPATAQNSDGTYIIGGPPVLLIQTDTVPPTSALNPLPSQTYSTTLTLSWSVSDDSAGYWYEEIERAPSPTGPWTLVAGLAQTSGKTQVSIPLTQEGLWYFRSRARDRVGNWEAWPPTAETSTTVHLKRTVTLSVTTYLDDNNNGIWDAGEVAPPSTTTLRWLSSTGDVVAETTGATWEVTRTVLAGAYGLKASTADRMPAWIPFTVIPSLEPITLPMQVGLRLANSWVYLPVVARNN